jgi:hypothetical protein
MTIFVNYFCKVSFLADQKRWFHQPKMVRGPGFGSTIEWHRRNILGSYLFFLAQSLQTDAEFKVLVNGNNLKFAKRKLCRDRVI